MKTKEELEKEFRDLYDSMDLSILYEADRNSVFNFFWSEMSERDKALEEKDAFISSLNISLSNYAYEKDRAKRDRDNAESKLSAKEKENAELREQIDSLKSTLDSAW